MSSFPILRAQPKRVDKSWKNPAEARDNQDEGVLEYYSGRQEGYNHRWSESILAPSGTPGRGSDSGISAKRSLKSLGKVKSTSRGRLNGRRQSNGGDGGSDHAHGHFADFEYFTSKWFTPMLGFDIELWWARSNFAARLNVIMIALLAAISIAYFAAGIFFVVTYFTRPFDSAYLCKTDDCHKASTWMEQSMNFSVDPCHNFYEFMCGNYNEDNNEEKYFSDLFHTPVYKVEFGEDSYLAKMLKYEGTDEKRTQAIKYYQACIDDRDRPDFGFEAFKDLVERVFGTKNFIHFESSPSASNMELIAANMFRGVGHAVFINMGFFDYPFIQVLKPTLWVNLLTLQNPHDKRMVNDLMPRVMNILGLTSPNSTVIGEMVEGIHVMDIVKQVLNSAFVEFTKERENEFLDKVRSTLKGLCPPMGIQLDLYKIYENFTGEDPTKYATYYSYASEKYFKGLQVCFKESPSSFQGRISFSRPKTAFVAYWVFGLFYELLPYMETGLVNQWDIFDGNFPITAVKLLQSTSLEFQCFTSLWRTLGYVPSIRFLQATVDDPSAFIQEKEEHIDQLFELTRQKWFTLPETVNGETKFLGETLFRRGLHADVMMSLEGGYIDYSTAILPFTNDHLRNSIVALEYTIEHARQMWIGSVHSSLSVKWWAYGEGRILRSDLLSLQQAMVVSARFATEKGAARNEKWDMFLRRKPRNYVLFPLTLFNEPHTSVITALEHAGIHFKIIRTFLELFNEASDVHFFGKYEGSQLLDILDWNDSIPQPSHSCHHLNHSDLTSEDKMWNTSSEWFSFYQWHDPTSPRHQVNPYSRTFYSLVAAKISFHLFEEEVQRRKTSAGHAYSLSMRERYLKLNRMLPGRLTRYSEEQLYFMALVRQVCKGSWKKSYNDTEARFKLEVAVTNVLMGMHEFSTVWGCKPGSRMNLGEKSCLRWTL